MVFDCARECPLYMPEQITFQEFLGKAGTTYRNKRFVRQMALLVDGPRDDALARAAFSHDQYGCRGFGRPHQHLHYFAHNWRREIQHKFRVL